jgi:thiol-disulfide isomerase/thioredoxin
MIRHLLVLIAVTLLFQSCGEDSSGTGTPVLFLDRETVGMEVFAGSVSTTSFFFNNAGDGVLEIDDLALTIRSGGVDYPWTWLDVDPTSLRVEDGEREPVTLTADATYQSTGTSSGTMTFSTNDPNNSRVNIPVTVSVTPHIQPEISLSPTSIELFLSGGESESAAITVTNSGSASGDVTSITPDCDWITVDPASVHLEPGESKEILLTIVTAGLSSGGEYQCIVTFSTSDPETPTITVTVNVTVIQARVVVAEEFTATWCTFCPGAMLGLHQLEQQVERGKLAVVAYHLQDEFAVAGNDERATFYEVSPIPDVWFDGVIHQIGGDETTPVDYTSYYEQRAAVSAPMTLTLTVSDYSPGLGTGTVKAGMVNVSELPLDLNLLFVLTCADTLYSWQGQTHLYNTAIGFVGGVEGHPVTLEPQSPEETIQSDFSVPTAWIGRDLQIVAMAQAQDPTREIYQGAISDLQ